MDTSNVIDWNARPKRVRRAPPPSYWDEYVATDEWYLEKLIEDVPDEEMFAALEDECFDEDEGEDSSEDAQEGEEEGEEDDDYISSEEADSDDDEAASSDDEHSGSADRDDDESQEA